MHEKMKDSPEYLKLFMNRFKTAMKNEEALTDETILMCWLTDSKETENILLKKMEALLKPPINPDSFKWFKEYVSESLIWFKKSNNGEILMYEKLLDMAKKYNEDINKEYGKIYEQFSLNNKFQELISIENKDIIKRNDDSKVGMFSNLSMLDEKKQEEFESKSKSTSSTDKGAVSDEELRAFVNLHCLTSSMISVAYSIDKEFHATMSQLMDGFGVYKNGPPKTMDRCQAKIESDYLSNEFPQCSQLLDTVRGSLTFDSVESLINGYNNLISVSNSSKMISIARIKNGFADTDETDCYKDLKVNVLFISQNDARRRIICEIQFLLAKYLQVKKKGHKLYQIIRRDTYFTLVKSLKTNSNSNNDGGVVSGAPTKIKQFAQIDTTTCDAYKPGYNFSRCDFDPDSNLLTLTMSEGGTIHDNVALTVINIKTKEVLLQINKINVNDNDSVQWIKFKKNDENMCLAYSNHNQGGRKIHIWDPTTKKEIHCIDTKADGKIKKFCVDSQNNIFIVTNAGSLYTGNIRSDKMSQSQRIRLPRGASGHCIAVTDNGKYAITFTYSYQSIDFTVINMRSKTEKQINIVKLKAVSNPEYLESVATFKDIKSGSDFCAIGTSQGKIEIWNLDELKNVTVINVTSGRIALRSVFARGMILAAVGWDGILRVWTTNDFSKPFFEQDIKVEVAWDCLQVTSNSKFLTVSGQKNRKAVCRIWQLM